jgi:hypothetical protein
MTTILYARNLDPDVKLFTLLSDIPKTTECLVAERLGLHMNVSQTYCSVATEQYTKCIVIYF